MTASVLHRLYLVPILILTFLFAVSRTTGAAAPLLAPPAAPSDLVAAAMSPTEVQLTWVDHATTETVYQVYRSLDGGWSSGKVAELGADATSFADSGLNPCTQYTYRVRATTSTEQSPMSNWASATTLQPPSAYTMTEVDEDFDGGAVPAGWENLGAWAILVSGGSPVGGNAIRASSAGGVLRTPPFDCSSAREVVIDFYKLSSVPGTETAHYRVYFEGAGAPLLLAEYTNLNTTWTHEAFTLTDASLFSSSCSVAFEARVSSGLRAHLDGVTISQRVADPAPPTAIVLQPDDVSTCEGSAAVFAVQASGEALTTQWQVREGSAWQNVGAGTLTYEIPSVTLADSGKRVRAVVTGSCGVAYSYAATLTVTPGVTIATQPAAQTPCEGASASFAVAASGAIASYQWERDSGSGYVPLADGETVSGAATAALVLTRITAGDAGTYRCVVAGGCAAVASEGAALTLSAPATITLQPQSQTLLEGAVATLAVSAEGPSLSYQWETSVDGGTTYAAIAGATDASYSTPSLGIADDGRQYRATVTSGCGTISSAPATVTVLRQHEIPLSAGWNAISMAIAPLDPAIDVVLSGIAGNYSLVYAWQQAGWRIYDPASPASSDLQALDSQDGFWLLATAPATLRVAGRVPSETTVPLTEGWSLVGFPGGERRAVALALNPANACSGVSLVYAFTAGEEPAWRHFDYAAADWSNTLDEMVPGYGYWVRSSQACNWRVTY